MTAQCCLAPQFASTPSRLRSSTGLGHASAGLRHSKRARLQCASTSADASPAPDDKQSVARSTGERAIGLWQSFVTLVRNPAASQKLEKSWRVARRNRHQYFKRLWTSFWESKIGQLLHQLWGYVMIVLFPFQILALTIHMQLYKLSLVYNSYCLDETERAWRWGNIYEKESECWKSGFALFKAVLLWAIYFVVTPATMVWMMPPVLMSAIMADRWRDLPKTGSFIAVVLFWFLKFPLGTPIQWL